MTRCAPINIETKEHMDQVFTFKHKSICYIDPKSHLYKLVSHLSLHDRNGIEIDSVVADSIYLNVYGPILPATRRPAVGLVTFDCINNDGDLDRVHLGHKICKLILH